jgi:hypothetical protein
MPANAHEHDSAHPRDRHASSGEGLDQASFHRLFEKR